MITHNAMKSSSMKSSSRDQLYLEVPAQPENVGKVRRQLADFTEGFFVKADDTDALLLAVGEACNNAVNYGGKNRTNPLLVVWCRRLNDHDLQVDVRNQGDGFDPDLEQMGRLPDDQFATHGRGFGLMLALVDSVQILSDNENTTVRLTKSRTL